jgi:integrase
MARVKFTLARIRAFDCPPGKTLEIYWDTETPGLGLSVTANGAKRYVFQTRLHGVKHSVRTTIGEPGSGGNGWTIEAARDEARRLRRLVDAGRDPRVEKAETFEAERAAAETRRLTAKREAVTLRDAWDGYLAERRPKWSDLHYRDHVALSSPGGVKKQRGKGLTRPGPLAPLMAVRLADLNAGTMRRWLDAQAAARPARARLAFNLLRIFATWCEGQPEYAGLIDSQAVAARLGKDALPKRIAKRDALQREQLRAWFAAVCRLDPVMETYLTGLLLTGARREELAGLKWTDVDFRWRSMHLKDKVETETGRTIPIPPFFASLLLELKRLNDRPPNVRQLRALDARGETWQPSEFVFFSKIAHGGRLTSPNRALHRICEAAGIPPLTLHGLRRSFSTLSEWVELPTGITSQIMGHRPSATAERHYKVRPLDLLRQWHDRLEAWILREAGIEFEAPAEDAQQAAPDLRAVK